MWQRMAELGWIGILVPETYGGSGLGLADTAIVAEGVGRALMPEPFTASAVLAAGVLAGAQNEALKQSLLPAVVRGDLAPALAWQERPATLDGAHIAAPAVPFEGGYRLNGTKRYVSGAAGADVYIVAARVTGDSCSRASIATRPASTWIWSRWRTAGISERSS